MDPIAILVLVIVVVIVLVEVAFLLRRRNMRRASRGYSDREGIRWSPPAPSPSLFAPPSPRQYGSAQSPQQGSPYPEAQPPFIALPPSPAPTPAAPSTPSAPSTTPSQQGSPYPAAPSPTYGSAPSRSEPSIASSIPIPLEPQHQLEEDTALSRYWLNDWVITLEPQHQLEEDATVIEDIPIPLEPQHQLEENATVLGPVPMIIDPVVKGDFQASYDRAVEGATTQDRTDVHYSDVSFPGQTVVGQMEALRVAITRRAMNTRAAPLPLERSSDDTQPMKVDAYVVVSPLDFDLESSNVQTITVFPNTDSAPVLFKLLAKSEGRKTIAVEFFQNARYLGRAELETAVSQQVQYPHPVSAQATLEMSATQLPPDLTILFDRVPVGNDRHYYRYRLLSPIRELNLWFDEFRSPETNVTPQGFLEETFTQLNRMLSSDTPGEFFFGRLNSIGMSLYRRLFSDDFKHLYWNSLRNKVQNIVIISFEPWIPWELVRPFNHETNEADDGFLCEKFNLTRWLAGAGFPDTISLEQLGLIVSTSSLDSAKLEAEEIKKLLGSKARDILSSSPSVYRLLRTNDLYGLHFACHGSFNKDNPDMSTLSLEDGTWLSPIDIDGDGLTFGKNRPLVFLNACETGQGGYALTGMGGWAEAFVGRARCSGLIGSIWKAKDESACKFAVAFYRNLLDGKTIAEAARLARLSIKQTGDPTWLSYTVYANPLAHLVIDRSLQRDNPILQPRG